jgi:hypothetical protein
LAPYWFLILLPTIALFHPTKFEPGLRKLFWLLTLVFICIFVGLRHEVGGDWVPYLRMHQMMKYLSLQQVLLFGDPGYYFLNWVFSSNSGIYWVNLSCSAIVTFSIGKLAFRQPNPWLALFISIPYVIIVIAMGYTRQSVAMGFVIFGFLRLLNKDFLLFILFIFMATLFHKSAIIFFIFPALIMEKNKILLFLFSIIFLFLAYYLFLNRFLEAMWSSYIVDKMKSDGAIIRLLLNAISATLFLYFGKQFKIKKIEYNLWHVISIISLIILPLGLTSITVVDRLALYFLPLQLVTLSHLPYIFKHNQIRSIVFVGVVGLYGTVQFVWLFFANNSASWIPFKIYPIL